MPVYTINPVQHNKGGYDSPYEKYHLTEDEHTIITRNATETYSGLMPYAKYKAVEFVDTPTHMTDPGSVGQIAVDEYYVYFYTEDGWRSAELETF